MPTLHIDDIKAIARRAHDDAAERERLFAAMRGDDIADVAVYAANAPAHVQVAEVLILATHQGSGSVIVRK